MDLTLLRDGGMARTCLGKPNRAFRIGSSVFLFLVDLLVRDDDRWRDLRSFIRMEALTFIPGGPGDCRRVQTVLSYPSPHGTD